MNSYFVFDISCRNLLAHMKADPMLQFVSQALKKKMLAKDKERGRRERNHPFSSI
jgi:hypothetical protein